MGVGCHDQNILLGNTCLGRHTAYSLVCHRILQGIQGDHQHSLATLSLHSQGLHIQVGIHFGSFQAVVAAGQAHFFLGGNVHAGYANLIYATGCRSLGGLLDFLYRGSLGFLGFGGLIAAAEAGQDHTNGHQQRNCSLHTVSSLDVSFFYTSCFSMAMLSS